MTAIVTHVFLALGAGDASELPRHNLQPRPPHLRWRPKSKGLVVVCRGAWFLGQCLAIEDCCEISRRKEVEMAGRRAVDAGTSTIGVASMLRRDETATAAPTAGHPDPAGRAWAHCDRGFVVGSTPWRGNLEATQATRFWTGAQGAAPSSGGAASRWARPRDADDSKTTTQAHRYGIQ